MTPSDYIDDTLYALGPHHDTYAYWTTFIVSKKEDAHAQKLV